MEETSRPFSSRFAITTRRPVAILMIIMAVCVFGWVSYQRLSLDLMPDITYPTLTVRTEYPGTAPEEVETFVSRPLEQELGVVPHLVSISSISQAGQSDIILEFAWDTDMNAVSQDIREKVDRVWLPEEAKKPLLLRYDPSLDPILRIGLYGPQTLYDLRYVAEREIKREVEAVEGVAAVKIKGGLEEEIHVALNERQMALLGLDIAQINDRLAQDNINLPGGNLREGQIRYLIRTLNEFGSLAEIADLVIARQDQADIRLRDIARVYKSHKDREIITRIDGRESVEIEVYKEADANIVAVAQRVAHRLYGLPEQQAYVENMLQEEQKKKEGEEEEKEEEEEGEGEKHQAVREAMERRRMTDFISYRLPPGAEFAMLSDQSVFIVHSIREVQNNALLGGAMAIVVLFVFLRNIVHTLIVGLTIPVSIIATFAPMHLFEVSLNIMSLGGLALGIGMLVDNSIVVLESIFRCREEGDDLLRATVRGTGEVGSAVFASTLTTIAVFFPIVFVEGMAGQVFGDMALTVVFSLLASLGVALYFIPMLASRQVRRGDGLVARFQHSDFLQLQALERGRRILAERPRSVRRARAALCLPYLIYELLGRILLAVAVLVAALLKCATMLLFELLWWLIKPIEYFWIKPARSLQTWMNQWAGASRLGPWDFFNRVWPNILSFGAAAALSTDIQRFCGWIRRSRRVWTRCKALLFPLGLVYLMSRFILHALLCLVGIVLHTGCLLLGLVLVAVLHLLAMVLLPLLGPVLYVFEHGLKLVQQAYPVFLSWALRQRLLVIAVALGSFLGCWFEVVPRLGRELIPQVHQGEFNLDISLPVGAPLERTAEVLRAMEEVVLEQPRIERVSTTVGSEKTATSTAEEGEHTGRITVKLQEGSDAASEEALIHGLRRRLRDVPEVEIEVSHPALFSFKTPVEVEIRGYELRTLRRLSRQAEAVLSSVAGLVDVKSSLQAGHPELQVVYDRDRLARYGLDLREVAEQVRHKVQGRVATDFRKDERNLDILVRLREDDRVGLEELERLVVNPGGEVPIPLAAIASIRVNEGPSEIRRIDQQRAALISANIQDIDLGTASEYIDSTLRGLDFPAGFTYLISGQNREMETSMRSLTFALALAIFLVYIVMASQFESLVHPFVIMFTVPLALIGVAAALYIRGIPLSIVVFIGLIMLAGIVVNNAIVLVDYINTLRRGGLEKFEAIVQAASVRLRPILMTALTTVLALLPMALGLGEGTEIRTPMALTVIAGLTSSTVLTLIVIPTVYSLMDRRP